MKTKKSKTCKAREKARKEISKITKSIDSVRQSIQIASNKFTF